MCNSVGTRDESHAHPARGERPGQRIKVGCCTQGHGSRRFGFLAIGLVVEHFALPTRARRAGAGVDLSASRCTSSRTSQTRLSSPDQASSLPTRKRQGAFPTSHLGMSGACEATDLQAWCREQTGLWAAHRIVWEAGLTLRARGARSRRRCNNLADDTLRIIVFLIFLARIHRSATSCHGERAVGQYKGSACLGLAAAHPTGGRERALYIIQLRPRAPRPKSRPRLALRTPFPDTCSGLPWSLLLILRRSILLLQRDVSAPVLRCRSASLPDA